MVKGMKRGRTSSKSVRSDSSKDKCTDMTSVEVVANINTNHSPAKIQQRRSISVHGNTKPCSSKEVSVKSKVVVPEKVNFKEDGEIVEMEITDCGAAVAEFASEEELDERNKPESEDSTEETSDDDSNLGDSTESSEIPAFSDDEQLNTSGTSMQQRKEVEETALHSPKAKKKKRKSSSKQIFQDRLDTMSSTLLAMKELMVQSGLTGRLMETNHKADKPGTVCTEGTSSETTIYQNVLEKANPQNFVEVVDAEISFKVNNKDANLSSSSEERIDTSDELLELEDANDNVQSFIAECAAEAANSRKRSLSKQQDVDPTNAEVDSSQLKNPEGQAELLIKEAEASKARIMTTPGKYAGLGLRGAIHHSTMVDENYVAIGGFVEPSLCDKIINGEYVDFARLLPRGRVSLDAGGKLELVNRGGQTFFVPAGCEQGVISNFSKWEQAFHVFSNIYMRKHPERATELIQYNHIIFMASSMYIWENVYTYDREFRTHLNYFPDRSWAIILQQAWAMYLKDRINYDNGRPHNGNGGYRNKKEICERFNKGLCTAGRGCKYDHRCKEFGKFGHGAHICRRKSGNQAKDTNLNS